MFKVFEQPIAKFSDLNITVLKWHDEHGTTLFQKGLSVYCRFRVSKIWQPVVAHGLLRSAKQLAFWPNTTGTS